MGHRGGEKAHAETEKGGADMRARGIRERRATQERMLASGHAGRAGPGERAAGRGEKEVGCRGLLGPRERKGGRAGLLVLGWEKGEWAMGLFGLCAGLGCHLGSWAGWVLGFFLILFYF